MANENRSFRTGVIKIGRCIERERARGREGRMETGMQEGRLRRRKDGRQGVGG